MSVKRMCFWVLFVMLFTGMFSLARWFYMDANKRVAERHKIDERVCMRCGYRERVEQDYARGVNDALNAMSLLALEQRMDETNRTWGAMAEIVCQRLKVERAIK